MHGPGYPDEAHDLHLVFWFVRSEVNEAEAAELPELGPVPFLRIESIAITLDGELVGWFRRSVTFDRVDTPLLDLSHDADVRDTGESGEVEQRQVSTSWSLRGRTVANVLDRQPQTICLDPSVPVWTL